MGTYCCEEEGEAGLAVAKISFTCQACTQSRKHDCACLLQESFGKLKSRSEYLRHGYWQIGAHEGRWAALTWVARAVGDQVLRRFEQKRARIEGYANHIANQVVLELLRFLELGRQLRWLVFRRSGLHDTSCVPTSETQNPCRSAKDGREKPLE